jgi:tetratricopeptide (TPR) repeat protein
VKVKLHFQIAILCLFCMAIVSGCSTKQNTAGTRAYHDLTTRYNILFNAQQIYDEALQTLYNKGVDNYSELIPMYPNEMKEENRSGSGPFDAVIEKTKKAIQEHSISVKPRRNPDKPLTTEYREWLRQEEFNPALKEVWLLMGKAQVQNGSYSDALSTFSQILRMYKNETELISETQIWMLRTYSALGWLYDAENIANILLTKPLTKQQNQLFNETYAYYLLCRKNYESAIPYLRQAIKSQKNFSQKIRLQFLLGQLYAEIGLESEAFHAFGQAKGLNTPPIYAMQATIFQTRVASGNNRLKAIAELEKMANNSRFTVANDSLYITLGDFYTAQNDTSKANRYYAQAKTPRKAISSSISGQAAPTIASEAVPDSVDELLTKREMLAAVARARSLLSESTLPGEVATINRASDSIFFSSEKNVPSLFLALFSKKSLDKNKLLFSVANFNFSTFMLRDFRLLFTELPPMEALEVKGFENLDEAVQYASMLMQDSTFIVESRGKTQPMIISEENMKMLSSGKTIADYLAFYKTNFGEVPTMAIVNVERPLPDEETFINKKEKTDSIPESFPQQITTNADSMRTTAIDLQIERQAELERKAQKALEQEKQNNPAKNRERLMKERERERNKLIKQREKERKEMIKKREQELQNRQKELETLRKQREKERLKQFKK